MPTGEYREFKKLWNPRLTDKQKTLIAYLKEHPGDMREAMTHAGYAIGKKWQSAAVVILRNRTIREALQGSKEGTKEKIERYRMRAVEKLVDLLDRADSPGSVLKAAEAILDRTGFSRDQTKLPEKEVSDDSFDQSLILALKKAKEKQVGTSTEPN